MTMFSNGENKASHSSTDPQVLPIVRLGDLLPTEHRRVHVSCPRARLFDKWIIDSQAPLERSVALGIWKYCEG